MPSPHHEHASGEEELARYCQHCGAEMRREEAFGRHRPVCPGCGRVHFRDPKVAAGVLVVEAERVLLVKRALAPQKGKWSIPAGFVDADEDPAQAAARECLEETGLRVAIDTLLDVIAGKEHPRGASIVIVYRAHILGGELAANDDAAEAGFFDPNTLPELAFDATRRALEHLDRNSPI